jgi:DNA-binding CsgD family transcriptional regulator
MTAGILPGQPPSVEERQVRAAELYQQGLSLRQVAARLGVSHTTVKRDLHGVQLRPRALRVVRDPLPGRLVPDPAGASPTRFVPPERAALAFTPERGWHMTQAPPSWFSDLLAEMP